jgi:hypothetical protein
MPTSASGAMPAATEATVGRHVRPMSPHDNQRRRWPVRCAGFVAAPPAPEVPCVTTGIPRVAVGSPRCRWLPQGHRSVAGERGGAFEPHGGLRDRRKTPRPLFRGSRLKAAAAPQDHRAPRRTLNGAGYSLPTTLPVIGLTRVGLGISSSVALALGASCRDHVCRHQGADQVRQ